jgi:hypothetical protein
VPANAIKRARICGSVSADACFASTMAFRSTVQTLTSSATRSTNANQVALRRST